MNNLEVENQITNDVSIENKQRNFLQTNIGKAVNTGLNIGLRYILPDVIEDQVIEIKDSFLQNGFKEGIQTAIDSAKPIIEQLIQYNKVKRPYIGISGRDLDETTAKRNNLVVGVYVASVDEYSAAEKAGIKAGDVIVKADGQEIKTMTELNNIKNTHNIGDTMTVTVNRNGQEKEITLTLQEQ